MADAFRKTNILPLLVCACMVQADEQRSFVPADFDRTGEHFIGHNIVLPNAQTDISVLIRCISTISRTGRMNQNHCFALEEKEKPYALAIQRAALRSKISPATVNKKETKVIFNYLVRIRRNGADQSIRVYPNWGLNFKSYGTDYTAAQPYSFLRFPTACRGDRDPFFALTSVMVKASGLTQEVEIYSSENWFSHGCRVVLERYAIDRSYIPAFSAGSPVDSQYLEPWWRDSRWEIEGDTIIMPKLSTDFEY